MRVLQQEVLSQNPDIDYDSSLALLSEYNAAIHVQRLATDPVAST